jgi:hypothetical protein
MSLDTEKKQKIKELIIHKKDLDKKAFELRSELDAFNKEIRDVLGVSEQEHVSYDDLLLKVL